MPSRYVDEALREKIAINLPDLWCNACPHFGGCEMKDMEGKACKWQLDYADKLLPLLQPDGWVSALKKYNITVDSPESLVVSVDILIEEARQAVIKEIEDNAGEALFLLEDLPFWQALKKKAGE